MQVSHSRFKIMLSQLCENQPFSTSHQLHLSQYTNIDVLCIAFYCLKGKNLVPTYEEVATNLKGVAIVAKIDATVEEGLAHRYGIRGFPTLKLFKPGSKGKDLQDYQGARSAAALVSFVTGALSGNGIHRIKSSNHESLWTQKPVEVPRVILFSSKAEPSTLYKSLSMRFASQLVFAQVQQNDPLCSEYSVDTFPSVLVIKEQGAEPVKFEGKLGAEALTEFLSQFAASDSASSNGNSKASQTSSQPTTTQSAPKPAASWKEASDWSSLSEACGKHWCILLLNPQSASLQAEKDLALVHYGRDGKFQFVEVKGESDVDEKFNADASSAQWIIYNAKKSKFAASAFEEGQVPSALLDRIVSGDAKLTRISSD